MTIPYEAFGKQITRAGSHVADCASNEAADLIAASLNVPEYLDTLAAKQVTSEAKAALQVAAGNLRAQFHVIEKEAASG